MLLDLFKEKRCFKLICGAGNEDASEVEKLAALYSKAGCNFFDICAEPSIISAANRGLLRAGIQKDRYLCCSIGTKDDPHIRKAGIIQETCIKCGACPQVCPQNAISAGSYEVNIIRCTGCGKCAEICPSKSILMKNSCKSLKEILPPVIAEGVDCLEFHTQGADREETLRNWEEITELFDGVISICISRSKLGSDILLELLKNMIKARKPYTTIIQADGAPMSGGKDDFKTTLQAVSAAEIIQNADLPVYIMLSGGTNSKSTELAKMCGVTLNGIAIGSYARKIVQEYIKRDDFLENGEIFNKALSAAKNLVDISLKFMKS